MYSFVVQRNDNTNFRTIGQTFMKSFYTQMSTSLLNLNGFFNQNVICTFDGEEFIGVINLQNKLSKLEISRFDYQNVNNIMQPLINNEILIHSYGQLKAYYIWNSCLGNWLLYNEVIILEKINEKYYIKNYMFSIQK